MVGIRHRILLGARTNIPRKWLGPLMYAHSVEVCYFGRMSTTREF